MNRRFGAILTLLSICSTLFTGMPARAQEFDIDPGFDPNRILEDEDIFDLGAMSFDRLVQFVRSKGALAEYRTPDIDGVPKTAAEIIWRVATSYKINPKYLLALIQKEQSLVEDSNPSQKQFDWAAGYGVCDTCSKDDPDVQAFKGFASQLEWAAKQHREKYLLQLLSSGMTRAGKAPGKLISVDGLSVTPKNNATAMLYSYTPHMNGNLNLWRIWRRWFSLSYPDGTVVQGKGTGKTYLIRLGEKRPFSSPTVVQSLVDTDKIVSVSETELSAYPDGPAIRFPKFALLRDPKHRIWLLTGTSKRHIMDMKAFRKFGFNEDEVEDVADADLADYPVADPITVKTEFPQGVVMKEKETNAYWYIENNEKRQIPTKVFLTLYFRGRTIRTVSSKKLATYTTGNPYQLHDGELVRSARTPSVYVVENGELRPIPTAEAFLAVGWQWKNVITVPESILKTYTVGDSSDPQTAQPTLATL